MKNFSNAGVASKKINNHSGMRISDFGEQEYFRCDPLLYITIRKKHRNSKPKHRVIDSHTNFVTKILNIISEDYLLCHNLTIDINTPVSGYECNDIASGLQYTYSWNIETGRVLSVEGGKNTLD